MTYNQISWKYSLWLEWQRVARDSPTRWTLQRIQTKNRPQNSTTERIWLLRVCRPRRGCISPQKSEKRRDQRSCPQCRFCFRAQDRHKPSPRRCPLPRQRWSDKLARGLPLKWDRDSWRYTVSPYTWARAHATICNERSCWQHDWGARGGANRCSCPWWRRSTVGQPPGNAGESLGSRWRAVIYGGRRDISCTYLVHLSTKSAPS